MGLLELCWSSWGALGLLLERSWGFLGALLGALGVLLGFKPGPCWGHVGPFFALGRHFCLSETHFEFCFEKMRQKVRKSTIWASQNPPKILPKRHQNRSSNKHRFLHRFLLDFRCSLQRPNIKIRAPSQCFVDSSHDLVCRC